ncbi:right-handed parallel beta-helix repeat-containing protein [Salinispora arenicola]|uniref:right-handed parallel beta-helix repeat-containing protein n=1 Tax=Salinispora arenicola TaxID=168697 RepID=UPI00037195F2|nr:right-handed parallel beta-helix repeat-containing protein [Salinispora arenicola]
MLQSRRLPRPPGRRRVPRAVATVSAAALTGIVGLAGTGSATAAYQSTPGSADPSHREWSKTDGQWGGHWGTAGDPGWHRDDHGDHKAKGTPVPCDPNALIAAITAANQAGGGTLRLAEKCRYTLTVNQDDNGLPPIFQPITIHGQGATIIRAAAADNFRIFNVTTGGDLTLKDLTVAGGRVEDTDGGGILAGEGSRLTLKHVTVRDNIALAGDTTGGEGGGIYSDRSKVTITKSTITRNTAGTDGGGYYSDNAVVSISKSKVTHNTAGDEGGGLVNDDGNATISHTVISDNSATDGGGVHGDGDLTEIVYSTITRNTASALGGGIHDDGNEGLLLRHVTVAKNTATSGGGLHLTGSIGATIEHSKIVHNIATTGDGGGIAVNGEDSTNAVVALRRSTVSDNQATGRAGGIFFNPPEGATDALLTLTDVRVTKNLAQLEPGGIYNNGTVIVLGKTTIIDNRPTNCVGSPNPVPTCFG